MMMNFRYKKWDAVYKGNESNVFQQRFHSPFFILLKKRKDDENAKE